MNKKLFGWELDKNISDFSEVSKNMREEGHHSRADVIDYLIARVKKAEETIDKMERNEEFNRAAEYDSLN